MFAILTSNLWSVRTRKLNCHLLSKPSSTIAKYKLVRLDYWYCNSPTTHHPPRSNSVLLLFKSAGSRSITQTNLKTKIEFRQNRFPTKKNSDPNCLTQKISEPIFFDPNKISDPNFFYPQKIPTKFFFNQKFFRHKFCFPKENLTLIFF